MIKKPVAVQMWTVRKEMAEDLAGTLARIAEIGYAGVELWFPEFPPVVDLKALLVDTGLKAMGAHVPYLQLRDNFSAVAEYHQALGNTDLAIPIIPADLRQSSENWHKRIPEIAEIARKAKNAGFRFSYHNHAVEFQETVDGQEAHDVIFESIGADLLKAELDTFFIAQMDKDPVAYINRYSGRVPLLHLKEKSGTPEISEGTEIGQGVIDWDSVFAAAEAAGVEWYIVEQNCEGLPALESIRVSFEYLRSKGAA